MSRYIQFKYTYNRALSHTFTKMIIKYKEKKKIKNTFMILEIHFCAKHYIDYCHFSESS
jgi:hypothetical protein